MLQENTGFLFVCLFFNYSHSHVEHKTEKWICLLIGGIRLVTWKRTKHSPFSLWVILRLFLDFVDSLIGQNNFVSHVQ